IPHLLAPVITEPEQTIRALRWAVNEMERRYKLFPESRVKDIKTYNQLVRSQSKKIEVADENGNPQPHKNVAMPDIDIVLEALAHRMSVDSGVVEVLNVG